MINKLLDHITQSPSLDTRIIYILTREGKLSARELFNKLNDDGYRRIWSVDDVLFTLLDLLRYEAVQSTTVESNELFFVKTVYYV